MRPLASRAVVRDVSGINAPITACRNKACAAENRSRARPVPPIPEIGRRIALGSIHGASFIGRWPVRALPVRDQCSCWAATPGLDRIACSLGGPGDPANYSLALLKIDLDIIAQILGYLVAAGSLLLYTPIILRVLRQESAANGLALSTWWLKLSAYTATCLYCTNRGFPISTFAETGVITIESGLLLLLVAGRQRSILTPSFALTMAMYVAGTAWASHYAPSELLTAGQASATIVSTLALVPQLRLNSKLQDPGSYSPITAALACTGCAIRLFTTEQLAGGDPLLLGGYGMGLALNSAILGQIIYYGFVIQGKPLGGLLASDFAAMDSLQDKRK